MCEPEYAYRWTKVGLSSVSLIFISGHLIGDCQVFNFMVNLYTLLTSMVWLFLAKNGYSVAVPPAFLGVENIFTLASFMCIAGNTEDGMGMSSYEIVAVAAGLLWGLHTSHLTYVMTTRKPAERILLDEYEEFAF